MPSPVHVVYWLSLTKGAGIALSDSHEEMFEVPAVGARYWKMTPRNGPWMVIDVDLTKEPAEVHLGFDEEHSATIQARLPEGHAIECWRSSTSPMWEARVLGPTGALLNSRSLAATGDEAVDQALRTLEL